MHLTRESLRGFFRSYADRFAGADVHERGGNFSPIAKLESTLAETAAGDNADSVRGAAVNFNKGYETLAVFPACIFDAKFRKTEHRQSHAEHLPSAEMAMRLFSLAEIFIEGVHTDAISDHLSA
jgi:hypothetical protein